MTAVSNQHALIIGASVTGLMAARVMASHFARVTLIERDSLPTTANPRKGVPQSHQYHGLMAKGYHLMQRFYPELTDALRDDGIPLPDTLRDFIVYAPNGAGYLPRYRSGIIIPTCSRHRLEWHLRRLTLALPNVTAVPRTEVLGLEMNESGTAVCAVQVRYRHPSQQQGTTWLHADLVVDCSGRHSKIDRWLEQMNVTVPPRSERQTAVAYATRLYRPPAHLTQDWAGLLVTMQYPQNPRFGGLRLIEDGLWQVALAGLNGLAPPKDEEGFRRYAHELASPIIAQAMETAVPVTPIHAYQNRHVRRRHFDKLHHFPRNLLVLGDAHCCYNPLYGQGMTSAAMMVEVVRQASKTAVSLNVQQIHRRIAQQTAPLWRQTGQLDTLWATPNPVQWGVKQHLLNKVSRESLPLLAEDPALFIKATGVRHHIRPVWQGVNGRFFLRLLGRLLNIGAPGRTQHQHPTQIIPISEQKPA